MRAGPPHHGLDLNADIGAYIGNEAHNPYTPNVIRAMVFLVIVGHFKCSSIIR
jgi:hypothetical protein